MRFAQKVNYSFIIALLIFALSMVFAVVPCQKAPNLPNPEFSSGMCTLNPDSYVNFDGKVKFYGMSESLAQTYLLTLALGFLLPFIILNVKLKKKD